MGFNLAMLVVMTMMLLISNNNYCAGDVAVKKNKSIRNINLCSNGSNKEECLLLSSDVKMEFLMDSESSKMVLETSAANSAHSKRPSLRTLNPGDSVCDRNTAKSCSPKSNRGTKIPPKCKPFSYNKDCHQL
ncbi:hypothetical protein REPUB_Repub01dG0171200 [Reevesia pubescens]